MLNQPSSIKGISWLYALRWTMERYICLLFLIQFQSVFAQSELDYFLEQAKQNSPLLKDYRYQLQMNAIDSQRIHASTLPQINAGVAGTYAPIFGGWGYDAALSNVHTLNAMVAISQPIISRNNLQNQYHSLQLQNQSLQHQTEITEQDLKRTITEQYITTYGDLLNINNNEQILVLLKQEEAILKNLTEKAVYKQTDFLSFLVTVQQQELLIAQLKIQYQNDYSNLNYISGIIDTSYTLLVAPDMPSMDIPLITKTIFLDQFKIDSLTIEANDEQIDLSYRPKANAFVDGGYASSFLVTPYKNFGFSAGITLTVPLYDGKQRELLHSKNEIAEQNRKAHQAYFTKQYSQQTAQLLQQLSMAEALIAQTTNQLKYTNGLISTQQQQLANGDVTITDYILAIRNYLNSKYIITQTTINRLQILNQINYWNRKS